MTINSASGLAPMDRAGTSDPYVTMKVGEQKLQRTTTKKKTLDPVWDETFSFRVESIDDDVVLQVCLTVDVDDRDRAMHPSRGPTPHPPHIYIYIYIYISQPMWAPRPPASIWRGLVYTAAYAYRRPVYTGGLHTPRPIYTAAHIYAAANIYPSGLRTPGVGGGVVVQSRVDGG